MSSGDSSMLVDLAGAVGAIAWTLAYALIVRRGLLDKTFGVPALAIFANLAWELYWVARGPFTGTLDARWSANVVWLALNLCIVVTFVQAAPRQFPEYSWPSTGSAIFFGWFGLMLVTFPTAQETIGDVFPAAPGLILSLLMSVLFIHMALSRPSREGQSFPIGYLKLLGSLGICTSEAVAAILADNSRYALLVIVFGVCILLCDVVYVVALRSKPRVVTAPIDATATEGLAAR